jgi:hypothetical protein
VHSFYGWLQAAREHGTVRFALVDRAAAQPDGAAEASLEVLLTGGERLRIGRGVNAATLRTHSASRWNTLRALRVMRWYHSSMG